MCANHEINAPVFAQDILTIGYEIDPPIDESRSIDNDVKFPNVNEVAEKYELVDHAFMDRENIKSNDFDNDVASRSNEDDDVDSEDFEERNKSADSDGSLLLSDNEKVPIKRKHLTHFNIEYQRPYFSWGMIFADAS